MKTKRKKKTPSESPDPVDHRQELKGQAASSGDEPPGAASEAAETGRTCPEGENAVAPDGKGDEADHASELENQGLKIARLEDDLLRAKAEQQNIRKRAANELTEAVRYANASLIKSLLETIDDFERTLQGSDSADARTLVQGVRLIYDNFMKVLQKNRIEAVEALGKPFDPRCHEAVQQVPSEGSEPGCVIRVLQQGFKLDDRVLRPAKVIVAASGSKGPVDPETQDGAGIDAAGATKQER